MLKCSLSLIRSLLNAYGMAGCKYCQVSSVIMLISSSTACKRPQVFLLFNCKLELLDAAGRVTQYLRPGRRAEVVFTTLAAGRPAISRQ